jgi:hypothetical protein
MTITISHRHERGIDTLEADERQQHGDLDSC